MKSMFSVCVAGFLSAFASQPQAADDGKKWIPDALRGQGVSEQLCVSCHLVKPKQVGEVTAGVPSFMAIANRPDQSGKRIANALIQSHPPMPNISLTVHEIGDIIAYIDTLRSPDSGKPLFEKGPLQKKKPNYPDQS